MRAEGDEYIILRCEGGASFGDLLRSAEGLCTGAAAKREEVLSFFIPQIRQIILPIYLSLRLQEF